MQHRASIAKYALIAFVVITGCGTDLLTKHSVAKTLEPGESITLSDAYLELTHARNESASFGILGNLKPTIRKPVLITAQVAGSLLVLALIFFHRERPFMRLLPFGLILGGAIGNAFDRVRLGHVVDFIHVHLDSRFSWPVFNVADILITAGLILLIWQAIVEARSSASAEPAAGS